MNRKRIMKSRWLYGILTALVAVVTLTACDSDSETEKQINGTWVCVQKESEDGVVGKITETVTYNAEDHTLRGTISMNLVYPNMWIGTMSYTGTWKASKTLLQGQIDENSIEIKLNPMLDASDRREMKKELLDDLKDSDFLDGGEILEVTSNTLKIKDQEDGTIYNYNRK